jgi:hypothetical protein
MKERIQNLFVKIKKMRYFLLFAIVLISINAYAWFTYVTRVDTAISAKVRSWNVMFEVHDNNFADEVVFTVGDMYPGMANFHDYASIVNSGETAGDAYFVIKRVQIFDDVYTSSNYSNSQLLGILSNNYPFTITLGLTNTHVAAGHTEQFTLDISWPYESGDDITDTYWGNYAYTYMNSHGTSTCISITAEVRVDQTSIP